MKKYIEWLLEKGYAYDAEPFVPTYQVRKDRRAIPRARVMLLDCASIVHRINEYLSTEHEND